MQITLFDAMRDEVARAKLTEIQNKATAHSITKDYNEAKPFSFVYEN